MKYRIWWIPQVPMKPFYYEVPSLLVGKHLLEAFALYDLFQLENHIKPDYSNTGGLQCFEDGEWCDWENENGESIDDMSFADVTAI
mgnify:FL=1